MSCDSVDTLIRAFEDIVSSFRSSEWVQSYRRHKPPPNFTARALSAIFRDYVDVVTEWDVLSERGGKGLHHPGNIRFLVKVRKWKPTYVNASKTDKTKIAKKIVKYVYSYGGRFLKKDKDGRYYVMTDLESRKKTSQALRDAVLYDLTQMC